MYVYCTGFAQLYEYISLYKTTQDNGMKEALHLAMCLSSKVVVVVVVLVVLVVPFPLQLITDAPEEF